MRVFWGDWIFLALALTIPVRSQPSSSSAESQQTSASNASLNVPALTSPNNIVCYLHFIEWLGHEDDRKQKETEEGKQQRTARIDYSAAIGISTEQEQLVLALLLDAYHRLEANKKQMKQNEKDGVIREGYTAYFQRLHPEQRALELANRSMLDEAWTKLRDELDSEDFQRLDAYVKREFFDSYPASLHTQQQN